MAFSLKPHHLKRYKDLVWLLVKYGRSDLVRHAGLEEAHLEQSRGANGESTTNARELSEDLERLGPTFIKLGQLLSTRADLVPAPYLESLARLQDDVEPFPFEQVREIVESELNVKLARAFSRFDEKPLAAASLGQVHMAALRDGREVVVKVQRPNIHDQIVEDFESLQKVAELLESHTRSGSRYAYTRQLDELRRTLVAELDYRQEAANLTTLRNNLAGFDAIVVPAPIDDYSTARVLTMEYVRGVKITDVSPVVLNELDGSALAAELFRAYLKQILVDGFFHADPHPGNVLLTEDRRIALLDVGMVARLPPDLQQDLLKMVLAISEGRGEDAAEIAIRIGEPRADFDRAEFRRRVSDLVARNKDAPLERLDAGRIVLEIARMSGESGILLPQGTTMIGKALLNLEKVARVLDPQFDPNAAIRGDAVRLLERRMLKDLSPGNVFHSILESADFARKLPSRLNMALDAIAQNKIRFQVDMIEETRLLLVMHKIANRITAGLVLAALIIGAALLMRVPTSFQILGYPGLAILLFLGAAAGGLILLLQILRRDHDDARPKHRGR